MSPLALSRAYIERNPVKAYLLVWVLSISIVALQIFGSRESGSQALLADVGHVLSDTVLALVPLTALLAVRVGLTASRVHFWSTILAAAILFAIAYHVGSEAVAAFIGDEHEHHHVDGAMLFIFSGLAAIANLIQHRILSRISPEHHHGAHKGLHFHVVMDLVKNLVLPILGILIALSLLPDSTDLWAALGIGVLLVVRAILLLYAAFTPGKREDCHAH